MKFAIFAFAIAAHASVIGETPVFQSGGINYTFDANGQAWSVPQGTPVTGVTYGFDPLPPCDACATPPPMGWTPPLVADTPVVVQPTPDPDPGRNGTAETPEPATWLVGLGLVALAWRRR